MYIRGLCTQGVYVCKGAYIHKGVCICKEV